MNDKRTIIQNCNGLIGVVSRELNISYKSAKQLCNSAEYIEDFLTSQEQFEEELQYEYLKLASTGELQDYLSAQQFILKNTKYAKKEKSAVLIKTENLDLSSYSDEELEQMLE